jgi:hypothetical protein
MSLGGAMLSAAIWAIPALTQPERLAARLVGAAVGVGDHRVGFVGWLVMQSGGDEAPMVADVVGSASIT